MRWKMNSNHISNEYRSLTSKLVQISATDTVQMCIHVVMCATLFVLSIMYVRGQHDKYLQNHGTSYSECIISNSLRT